MFVSAGYDIQTITRMTPEDLTAIGRRSRCWSRSRSSSGSGSRMRRSRSIIRSINNYKKKLLN